MQMRGDQRSRPCRSVFVHFVASTSRFVRTTLSLYRPYAPATSGVSFVRLPPITLHRKIVNLRRIKTINFAPLRERRCD